MGQYEIHAFVCTSGSRCPVEGDAGGVHRVLKKLVAEHGLKNVRVNQAGCMNQCGHGPMVVVYPQDVWYHEVTQDKARRIFEEHFLGGRVVEEYVYRNPQGDNKLPGRPVATPPCMGAPEAPTAAEGGLTDG